MTHRLTTNYAKNYCNWTLIVKVIVENVFTCFLGHGVEQLTTLVGCNYAFVTTVCKDWQGTRGELSEIRQKKGGSAKIVEMGKRVERKHQTRKGKIIIIIIIQSFL